jgi:hypothetical protein
MPLVEADNGDRQVLGVVDGSLRLPDNPGGERRLFREAPFLRAKTPATGPGGQETWNDDGGTPNQKRMNL